MDTMTRNHIFMENIDLINRTLRRHRLLLYALHLELDDVYQELAIAALQAIDTYDDRRCDSITVHIWAKLQYAVLTIKRRNKPHGIMACEGFAPGVPVPGTVGGLWVSRCCRNGQRRRPDPGEASAAGLGQTGASGAPCGARLSGWDETRTEI